MIRAGENKAEILVKCAQRINGINQIENRFIFFTHGNPYVTGSIVGLSENRNMIMACPLCKNRYNRNTLLAQKKIEYLYIVL